MAGRLKQPDCGGRDCTDDCSDGGAITWDCESKEGSRTCYGFSKFTNPNAGDVNRRLFGYLESDIYYSQCTYNGGTCGTGLYNAGRSQAHCAFQLTTAGSYSQVIDSRAGWNFGGTCPASNPQSAPACNASTNSSFWTATEEEKTPSATANGCISAGGGLYQDRTTTGFYRLTLPRAIHEFTGTITTGTSCRTHKASFPTLTADFAYTGGVSFSGTTVRVTVHLPIASAGDYTFVVDLQPYVAGTSTAETAEEEEVTITVESGDIVDGIVDYVYEVAVRDASDVEFVAARDLVAA